MLMEDMIGGGMIGKLYLMAIGSHWSMNLGIYWIGLGINTPLSTSMGFHGVER